MLLGASETLLFRKWETGAEIHCHTALNQLSAQALLRIPPWALSSVLGIPNQLLSLLASHRRSVGKQLYRLTLIKAWRFGRAQKRSRKLPNANQHVQIHGNRAEGKLSAGLPALVVPAMYHTQVSISALLQTASISISKTITNQITR